jgi:uncharacterized BrkB/YihY/UPF0761 family membrane protein
MSFYSDGDDFPVPGPLTTARDSRSANLVATIVLLVLLVLVTVVLSFTVVLEQMGVARCSGAISSCDVGLLGLTAWITPIVGLVFTALTVVALASGRKAPRRAWWVPCLGILLTVAAFGLASTLVRTALGG